MNVNPGLVSMAPASSKLSHRVIEVYNHRNRPELTAHQCGKSGTSTWCLLTPDNRTASAWQKERRRRRPRQTRRYSIDDRADMPRSSCWDPAWAIHPTVAYRLGTAPKLQRLGEAFTSSLPRRNSPIGRVSVRRSSYFSVSYLSFRKVSKSVCDTMIVKRLLGS